jgi:hypothetical protein
LLSFLYPPNCKAFSYVQPENFFKLVCSFARELDAAASETQARIARDATVRAARRAAAAAAAPLGSVANHAAPPDPSDWRKALRKIAGPVVSGRRPLREKDTLNQHIQAYTRLGRGAANSLLTRHGALQHLMQENITSRQSVPALRVETDHPEGLVAASQVSCRPGQASQAWLRLCLYRKASILLLQHHSINTPIA